MLRISHVGISVTDIERSAQFYARHFGFTCRERHQIEKERLQIWLLEKDGVVLELFCFRDCAALPGYCANLSTDLRTIGVKHFSFAVPDIQAMRDTLKGAGVEFETEIRVFENGARYFFIKDPDGILVEIMEGAQ